MRRIHSMTMKFDEITITDIIPATYNPRKISEEEYTKLANSIKEFGFVDPIIINLNNNHIIGGHQRYDFLLNQYIQNQEYETLNLLKLGDIGWIFPESDLEVKNESYEKALNLALNKISGEWDNDKLNELFKDLNLSDFDLDLTGFNELELQEFDIDITLTDLDAEENTDSLDEIIEEDYVAEDDLEVTVKKGDYYKLGNHYLLCGDSTDKKDIDKLIQNHTINIILTDPPYGMGLDTDYSVMKSNLEFVKEKNTDVSGKKYKPGLVDTFDDKFIRNILDLNVKETFLWGADYYTEFLPNLKEGSWIVWDKRSNETSTVDEAYSSDKMFGSTFELCWSKTKHKREIARVKWAGIFGTEQEFDHKRHHPTQKPIKLNAWFLERYSKENDNVLDVFGGSGSTLLACEQTSRNCFMMELDEYYCQVIINRWESLTGEKAIKI